MEAKATTFPAAVVEIRKLGHGLTAAEGDRLLERIAAHPEAARLRDALVAVGVNAILARSSTGPTYRTTRG
ncbi:MAG: hypothetical protein U0599_29070 [Vicinamibacteria bacterium]